MWWISLQDRKVKWNTYTFWCDNFCCTILNFWCKCSASSEVERLGTSFSLNFRWQPLIIILQKENNHNILNISFSSFFFFNLLLTKILVHKFSAKSSKHYLFWKLETGYTAENHVAFVCLINQRLQTFAHT